MKFRLIYEGPLKPNRGPKEKQIIRRQIHSQLKILWQQIPLRNHYIHWMEDPKHSSNIIKNVGQYSFIPLVSKYLRTVTELDIKLLRPEESGRLITSGGNIDNRIKTLLDGLRIPSETEINRRDKPREGENPFFCLLEDDCLITGLSVTTDRLLKYQDKTDVTLLITVTIGVTERIWRNIGIG